MHKFIELYFAVYQWFVTLYNKLM